MQARKPWINRFDNQKPGMKKKMRGGGGGKRMKTFDTTRRPMEPPKPKVVIPLICDLCNVKCDIREVFYRHLSGKKHISKLKQFKGGLLGLQALYPPKPIAPAATVIDSGFQQNSNPQVSNANTEISGLKAFHEALHQSTSVEPEAKQVVTEQMYSGSGVVGSEMIGLNPHLDNPNAGRKQANSVTHKGVPDYGAASGRIILPGLDMPTKEGLGQ